MKKSEKGIKHHLSSGSTFNMPVTAALPGEKDSTTNVSIYTKQETKTSWTTVTDKRGRPEAVMSRSAKWSKFLDMITSVVHFP